MTPFQAQLCRPLEAAHMPVVLHSVEQYGTSVTEPSGHCYVMYNLSPFFSIKSAVQLGNIFQNSWNKCECVHVPRFFLGNKLFFLTSVFLLS